MTDKLFEFKENKIMAKKTRAERNLKFETLQLHVGQETADPVTDARAVPIYQTSSFVFHNSQHAADRFALKDAGNIYGRLTNPTEDVFERRIAALEGGVAALAVGSGAAAVTYTIQNLALAGDHIVAAKNIYGGTTNLLEHTLPAYGITTTFVDIFNLEEVENAIQDNTKALYIETPSNPTMRVTDLRKMKEIADKHDLKIIVDNTFLSPLFQRPIELGADLVIHSGTKFLGGHNDTLAGFLCSADEETAKKIRYIYKTVGSCLAPFDSYLILRGIKTLSVRLRAQQDNAMKIANWLKGHEKVKQVYYVGLKEHPGYEVNASQASGSGSMISFKVDSEATARKLLESVKLIAYAESLGGVESLITYPMLQTHGDLPVEVREKLGITEDFLRLSVGIENADDLIADLEQALA